MLSAATKEHAYTHTHKQISTYISPIAAECVLFWCGCRLCDVSMNATLVRLTQDSTLHCKYIQKSQTLHYLWNYELDNFISRFFYH